jgi:hypothetical protein
LLLNFGCRRIADDTFGTYFVSTRYFINGTVHIVSRATVDHNVHSLSGKAFGACTAEPPA